MDDRQKINCTVGSCEFNDEQDKTCELSEIMIEPKIGCGTGKEDESMCGSYTKK